MRTVKDMLAETVARHQAAVIAYDGAPPPGTQQPPSAPVAAPVATPAAPVPSASPTPLPQPAQKSARELELESQLATAQGKIQTGAESYQELLRKHNRLVDENKILAGVGPRAPSTPGTPSIPPSPTPTGPRVEPVALEVPEDFTEAMKQLRAELGPEVVDNLAKGVMQVADAAAQRQLNSYLDTRIKPIEDAMRETAVLNAQDREQASANEYDRQMLARHADFKAVLASPDFIAWIKAQGDWAFTFQNMLFPTPETPPDMIGTSHQNADLIDRYKRERGIQTVQPAQDTRLAALERTSQGSAVPAGAAGLPEAGAAGEAKLLSVEFARINKIQNPLQKHSEFKKFEKDLREGKIVRDINSAWLDGQYPIAQPQAR